MLTQSHLDVLVNQGIILAEFRLLHHSDIPDSAHRAIKNICAAVRDDITHHKAAMHMGMTDHILTEWNRQAARAAGVIQ